MAKPAIHKTMTNDDLAAKAVDDLLLLIGDQDLGQKTEAMDRILSLGFQSIYPILEQGVRNDGNADLRNGAMEVLVRYGQESVPALVSLLRDENEEVRNFSAVMLGDIASRQAVCPLIDALKDPDINVSHAAAEALGKIGDDSALLPLLELLQGDFWLQYPAIVAMGEMADSRAVPHLLPLLENELLREPAVKALGQIADVRALPALVRLLCADSAKITAAAAAAIVATVNKGGNPAEQQLRLAMDSRGVESLLQQIGDSAVIDKAAAIRILGLVGDKAAIPLLLTLLEEHDYEEVVKQAIAGMASAAPVLSEGILLKAQKIQVVVLHLLRQLKCKVPVDVLLSAFKQGSPEVMVEVLASLVGTTDVAVFKLVEPLLENGTVDNNLTRWAAKVMARFSVEEIMPVWTHLLSSADPGKRAVAALVAGNARNDDFLHPLSALFRDSDSLVRLEAVKAAGRWTNKEFLPLLIGAFSDPEPAVRFEAIYSLTEYGEELPSAALLQGLGKRDERFDYEIIMAMGRLGRTDAENTLIKYLEGGGISSHLEFAVIETLGKIGSRAGTAWQSLCRYLGHGDPDIRRLAVEALARIAAGEFVEEIAKASFDPHWSVRITSLQVLGSWRSDQALPFIAAALKDPDLMVKKKCRFCPGKFGEITGNA